MSDHSAAALNVKWVPCTKQREAHGDDWMRGMAGGLSLKAPLVLLNISIISSWDGNAVRSCGTVYNPPSECSSYIWLTYFMERQMHTCETSCYYNQQPHVERVEGQQGGVGERPDGKRRKELVPPRWWMLLLLLLLLLTEPPAVHLREQMNGEERLIKWVTRTQVAFLGNAVIEKRGNAGRVQFGSCTCLQLGQEASDATLAPHPQTSTPIIHHPCLTLLPFMQSCASLFCRLLLNRTNIFREVAIRYSFCM